MQGWDTCVLMTGSSPIHMCSVAPVYWDTLWSQFPRKGKNNPFLSHLLLWLHHLWWKPRVRGTLSAHGADIAPNRSSTLIQRSASLHAVIDQACLIVLNFFDQPFLMELFWRALYRYFVSFVAHFWGKFLKSLCPRTFHWGHFQSGASFPNHLVSTQQIISFNTYLQASLLCQGLC